MTTTTAAITIVATTTGTPEVHAAGCADLKRGKHTRTDQTTIEATSREDIVRDWFSDFVHGDEDVDYYMDEINFYPCVKHLH